MSDAINFPQTPTAMQHPMQQQVLHQPSMTQQTPSHLDASIDSGTPPVPQIRIAAAHRSGKASGTPLPQMRNPPEPYGVHEFQPKTPERNAPGNPGEGVMDQAYMETTPGQFSHQTPVPSEEMQFHHTPSGPFPQGPFTPRGHTYLDSNGMQHIIHDPALLQQQQMQHQILQQQQQMFNPLPPPMMTPTHGMGMAPPRGPPVPGGPFAAAAAQARARGRPTWMQDPMHSILEEEKERKREMKLLKNREAAREGREKKRRYQMLLEARVSILETQNRALIEELKALKFLFCKPSSVMQQQHQQAPQQLQHQPHAMHYETPQTVV